MKRELKAIAILALAAQSCLAAQVAFPGAEGFGAQTTGGRGGDVYHVTSLADTNTVGTLRYGVSHAPSNGRTIVFDISGNINLASNLTISKPNITIAGQTAPGIGITVTGWQTSIQASNVVVRYMRFRPGDTYGPIKNPGANNFQGDALDVMGSSSNIVNNVVIDHVSTSWSIDEDLSVTYANNVTVQNSIMSEALENAGHDNGSGGTEPHSFGSLIRYGSGEITYSHNLYESDGTRNPRVGDNNKLDFVNNVLYNWGDHPAGYSGDATEGATTINYRGNYSIAGPSAGSHATKVFEGGSANTTIYQSGNFLDSNRNGVLDGADAGWSQFYGTFTAGTLTFPQAPVPVTLDTALAAYNKVIAGAGDSLVRDSVDNRIISIVSKNPGLNGAIIDSQDQVGGWDTTPGSSRPANWDTDGDGMPNSWEIANGFNPSVADNNVVLGDGYTALEHYLDNIPVPEPSSLFLMILPATMMMRRRVK